MEALHYFNSGYNCAESVLLALSDYTCIFCECIPAVAAGFGGGMKMGSVCGAVTGAIMGIGLLHGGTDTKARKNVNQLVKTFMEQFKKEYYTIVCRDLLGVDVLTEEGIQHYKKANLRRQCENYVTTSFQIAKTLLAPE